MHPATTFSRKREGASLDTPFAGLGFDLAAAQARAVLCTWRRLPAPVMHELCPALVIPLLRVDQTVRHCRVVRGP